MSQETRDEPAGGDIIGLNELSRCKSILDRIADSVAYPLIIIDDAGSVVLWNTAAEKIFGYSKEEALGTMLH
ncbi:MAG: hypothetical protein DRN35_04245, partial [Thermoplasmata archaeon]